jgi:hypothetical protein
MTGGARSLGRGALNYVMGRDGKRHAVGGGRHHGITYAQIKGYNKISRMLAKFMRHLPHKTVHTKGRR